MNFDFKKYWDSDHNYVAEGTILVNALVATGNYTEAEAVSFVNTFQNNSFNDGSLEEAFNNCGEDA